MIVALRFRSPTRPWHRRLAADLEAEGCATRLEPVEGRWSAIDAVLSAERHLYRVPPSPSSPKAPLPQGKANVAVALDGRDFDAETVLEPLFDGQPGEDALAWAIMRGRAPTITIRRRSSGEVLARGLPAIEDRAQLTRALSQVYVRLGVLLVQALRRLDDASQSRHVTRGFDPSSAERRHAGVAAAFLVRGFAGKAAHRLGPARGRPDHWQIGYRFIADHAATRQSGWAGRPFIRLPDDGDSFYADPFPFEHEGRHFLFFEDFSYATGKGVISVVEIDASGAASPPRVVLEQPVHLSYPLVMRLGDAIVMLPEMGGAGRIQLFRADPFPHRWIPSEVLVDDVVAADATPIWHEGRYWLFATVAGDGGSSWDQLALFHAPALTGPWTAHAANPVSIDAGAARPAGAMWHEDGVLMRVAQDCRAGYGAGLAICRVDRLDEMGYAQTVVARLKPPAGFGGARGVHTLNRAGQFEVIDVKVSHPR